MIGNELGPEFKSCFTNHRRSEYGENFTVDMVKKMCYEDAEDWENLRHKAYAAVYPDSEFLSEKFLCPVCAESRIQAVRGKSSCIDIRYLVIHRGCRC